MSDINKICAAITALVNALPGKSDRCTNVTLHGSDAARFRAIANAGATVRTYQSDEGTEEWDSASLYVNGIAVVAYSEHRSIVSADSDPCAVESALAQAQEALQ